MPKKLNFWIGASPLVLGLIITASIFTILNFLPEKLPLFYSLAWGEKQLATHQQFMAIPSSIGLIALVNLIISWQLHHSQSFFQKALLVSSIIVSLILTISFIKVILNFV